MAKSARASTKKRNNAKLRTKVFGPAIDARTERLSAKLQELANTPKPDEEKKMDVDDSKPVENQPEITPTESDGKEPVYSLPFPLLITMIDEEAMKWTGVTSTRKSNKSKASSRLNKISKRKPRNQVIFPSEMARKKRQAKGRTG